MLAQKLRNTYMHHGTVENPDIEDLEIATGSARGKLSFKVQKVTLQDVRRATAAISEAETEALGDHLQIYSKNRNADVVSHIDLERDLAGTDLHAIIHEIAETARRLAQE